MMALTNATGSEGRAGRSGAAERRRNQLEAVMRQFPTSFILRCGHRAEEVVPNHDQERCMELTNALVDRALDL
jgi:hypothetical protein